MTERDKPENPPAFPTVYYGEAGDYGMTLRDWFAGQFLAGDPIGYANTAQPERIVACAYELADAMLAEREKSK